MSPSSKHYSRSQLEHMDMAVLDPMAFGFSDGETRTFAPDQIKIIYPDDLGNPEHKFKRGGMAWAKSVDMSEPVELSVNDAGEVCLENGHHRWFAAGKTDRSLTGVIEIKGNPVRRILARQEQELAAQATVVAPESRRRRP